MRLPLAKRSRGVSPATAMLLFFALTAPLGIAAHLTAEFAGLGWHDGAALAFSARHEYLGAIALVAFASLVALVVGLRAVPRADRRGRIAAVVDALPFKGEGLGFVALSFAAQFAFFAITQVGEGSPLGAGDVVVGVIAAALAALAGAFAVTLGKWRIVDFVIALAFAFAFPALGAAGPARAALRRVALRASRRRTAFAFRYRPPPGVATSPIF
jgi:hypothetical protein